MKSWSVLKKFIFHVKVLVVNGLNRKLYIPGEVRARTVCKLTVLTLQAANIGCGTRRSTKRFVGKSTNLLKITPSRLRRMTLGIPMS